MPSINMGSIMSKVQAYSKSSKGKQQMNARIKQYVSSGHGTTAAGSKLTTEQTIYEAVNKLKLLLISTAQSMGVPDSVMAAIRSIEASKIKLLPDGSAEVHLCFTGDLHRDSLYAEGYNGVDNIVAVINNGYHARDYVYGIWPGHTSSSNSTFDDNGANSYAYIRSKKDREGMHFIQQTVAAFNESYGSDYNATAIAGDEYK